MSETPTMTETIQTVATPDPFRYRAVPIYPSDWNAECAKQNTQGLDDSAPRAFWASTSSSLLQPSTTSSTFPTRQQCFPRLPVEPAQSMPVYPLPGFAITASSSRLPVYGTEFTTESSCAFQGPADAASFSYGAAFVAPIIETSGFALNISNDSGIDLSANADSLYPGQGPVLDAACHADWNTTWFNPGFTPSYGFASYQDMFQTKARETHANAPFLSGLEGPTVNPAMVLQNIPYGSNSNAGMSSVFVASPSSVHSDVTLCGDSDTFTASSSLCIATPRASSRESARSLPTTGPPSGKERQSSRVPHDLEVGSPELKTIERPVSGQLTASRTPQTKTEPAETSGGVARLDRKRKHDFISPVASTVEKTAGLKGLKRNSKDRLPHPEEAVSLTGEPPVVPPKRKPGRPLSTSSTARAIVRDLAELHVGHAIKDHRSPMDISRAAFDHTLPPFPEVSVYVGEQIAGKSLGPIAEEEDEDRACGDDAASGEASDRPTRSNKFVAKKHRELIKERTKNLEDVKEWMDQALPEYERRNRRLLETIGRLRRENEALLAQGDHPATAGK